MKEIKKTGIINKLAIAGSYSENMAKAISSGAKKPSLEKSIMLWDKLGLSPRIWVDEDLRKEAMIGLKK